MHESFNTVCFVMSNRLNTDRTEAGLYGSEAEKPHSGNQAPFRPRVPEPLGSWRVARQTQLELRVARASLDGETGKARRAPFSGGSSGALGGFGWLFGGYLAELLVAGAALRGATARHCFWPSRKNFRLWSVCSSGLVRFPSCSFASVFLVCAY